MKASDYKISGEHFVLVEEKNIHDRELKTKPIGYFHDAFNRFKKNKASIVAFFIISILFLFAIICPFLTEYSVAYSDNRFACVYPKASISESLNLNFWDGCHKSTVNEFTFQCDYAIGLETKHPVIKNNEYKTIEKKNMYNQMATFYVYRKDSYRKNGVVFKELNASEYESLQEYQTTTGIQVMYPYTVDSFRPEQERYATDANFWFKTYVDNGRTYVDFDENHNYQNIYKEYTGDDGYHSLRIEGDTPQYEYAYKRQTGYTVRIDYYEYYVYYHKVVAQDGITKPLFLFGTNGAGKDIFTCLASGARFSFLLAFSVATVNLIVGAIYGAIEGYYGGKIDMVMERIVEILYDIPFIVMVTLLKYHMASSSHIIVLFLAFFLTGWISTASRTRMQFYRFKNQEYVLAARTLGASDFRIMFKHIFPNALGTLVTSCVLVIPGMIFSESTLSYLGIINLETGNTTSVGTLLASAKAYMTSYPYMMVPPALFICLLMLSFNLFGNGLRDAFNPSLRSVEE